MDVVIKLGAAVILGSIPIATGIYYFIVKLFQKPPDKPCPIAPSAVTEMEKLHPDKKEEFAQGQAQSEQQMEVTLPKDDQLKLEQAKIKTQVGERHKSRDKEEIDWLRQMAVQKLKLDYVNEYNIGISGRPGVGKSTIINGFRRLRSWNPGAARVGTNELSQKIKKYSHPYLTKLMLWDCPGAGTTSHPSTTYFYDKFLFAFDYLIFVCSDRIMEIEIDLMKQAIAHQVPFCFIRNKANDDLRNKCHDKPEFRNLLKDEQIKRVIEEDKEAMLNELKKAGIDSLNTPPLFVINSWAFVEPTPDEEKQVCFEETKLMYYILEMIYNRRNEKVDFSQLIAEEGEKVHVDDLF